MPRDYKKESAWNRKTYHVYYFRARIDNGEDEKVKKAIGDGSFAEWVRKYLNSEENKK